MNKPRRTATNKFVLFVLAFALLALTSAVNTRAAQAPSITKAERGITGTYKFQYNGPTLRAKVQRDTTSPLVVRLQRGQSATDYEARFIGNLSGQYDLREWLEHADGSPIAASQPMLVDVISTLPKDPRSDLFDVDGFQPGLTGGYRWLLGLAVLAWLAVPIAVIVRRFMVQPQELAPATVIPPLSLAEQIKPLITSAAQGNLSTPDKARLELLLVHYFRQQSAAPDLDMARSIQQLRSHPQAGPIIVAVEQWLHSADAPPDAVAIQRVLSLLEPLRVLPAECEPAIAGSAAP